EIKQNNNVQFTPSRLFIYYNERKMEGTVDEDSGAEIRDGIKSIKKIGVCDENLWKFDVSKITEMPTPECYEQAKKFHSTAYQAVSIDGMKDALAEGYPIAFGIDIYESFENPEVATTGKVP